MTSGPLTITIGVVVKTRLDGEPERLPLSHLQRGLSQAPSGSSRSSLDLDPAALGSDGGAAQRRGQEPQATPSSVVTLGVFLQIPTVGSVHFRLPTCENTWYITLREHVLTRYLAIWIDWYFTFQSRRMTGIGTLREAGLCENDTIRLAHRLRGGSARTAKTSSATSRAGTRVCGIARGKQAVYSTTRSGKRNGYET